MGGFVIWVIIVIWVVVAASKKAEKNKEKGIDSKPENRRPAGTVQNRTSQSTASPRKEQWQGYNQSGNQMKQQELKERLSKKYNQYAGKPQGDILQRAKASVEDDFLKNGYDVNEASSDSNVKYPDDQSRQKDLERRVAEKLAAAEGLENERYQQEHVLQTVEDLMVKGPDVKLTFERDFLSEGTDMLNRIQG